MNNWFKFLNCRFQVLQQLWSWHFRHPCLLYNITSWGVFLHSTVCSPTNNTFPRLERFNRFWKPHDLDKLLFLLKSLFFLAALYFVVVATFAALVGQLVVRKIVGLLGRASLIIFILAFTIFVSAVSLGMLVFHVSSSLRPRKFNAIYATLFLTGWVGIATIIGDVNGDYYMWFYNFCEYEP